MKRLLFIISFLSLVITTNAQTKLPYPIIFVHGLNSNSGTWSTLGSFLISDYGLAFGGRMSFCLNSDNNLNVALFNTDYTDFTATNNNLVNGDYFTVNFDVSPQGYDFDSPSYVNVQSNQSAIFKQGRAVRDAINHVLAVTNSDKVILVGHSMGGLASREYLSNSSIWQNDGNHHVAKLYTTDTPHGGSNTYDPTGGLITGLFIGLDESSEAVRDLRTTYYYTGNPGAYIFGGMESESYMWDRLFYETNSFYNVDVNCDGIIGESITGLNSKYPPADIYYTCAIGSGASVIGSGGDGDGIVLATSSNMNNWIFLNPPVIFSADTFMYYGSGLEFHTDMTSYTGINMRGLDEPDNSNFAYQIDTGKTYLGFITQPSQGSAHSTTFDYDVYKFYLSGTNQVKVSIQNPSADLAFGIYDSTKTLQYAIGVSKLQMDTILQLPSSGSYYLEVVTDVFNYNLPNTYSYRIDALPNIVTQLEENTVNTTLLSIYPNPALNIVNVDSKGVCTVRITSVQGENIGTYSFTNNTTIDVSNYAKGLYIFEVQNGNSIQRKTVVIQ